MKKVLLVIAIVIAGTSMVFGANHSGCSHHHSGRNCPYHSSGSTSSDNVYLVNTEHKTTEQKFAQCDKHYAIVETVTNYYSNGTRKVYTNSTIYNTDGTVLIPDCQSVEHVLYENNHYFLVKKEGYYQIVNKDGETISQRRYTYMKEISPERILVKFDKKYGMINVFEEIIIPIKYQEIKQVNKKIYITKLNHYYGVLDIDNNVLVKNECEKIKQSGDLIVIKKYGKFGIMDSDGNLKTKIEYSRIKHLGEYVLGKIYDKYVIFDSNGNPINQNRYEKVRLERNNLQGYLNKIWVNIDNTL